MSNPIKILKERIEWLINLTPCNIIGMKLIIDKAIDEIKLMIEDEMKNMDDIETKTMVKEKRVVMKRLWKSLQEFEMNESEIKTNFEKETL